MSRMKDLLMTIEELVYDAIEAGAKTDEDVLAWVNMYVPAELETIQDITEKYVGEWM